MFDNIYTAYLLTCVSIHAKNGIWPHQIASPTLFSSFVCVLCFHMVSPFIRSVLCGVLSFKFLLYVYFNTERSSILVTWLAQPGFCYYIWLLVKLPYLAVALLQISPSFDGSKIFLKNLFWNEASCFCCLLNFQVSNAYRSTNLTKSFSW